MDKQFFPYIKPNNNIHESGFGTFEIGYMSIKDCKLEEKEIISETVDCVNLYNLLQSNNSLYPRLDITLDGYIRILCKDTKWNEDPISTAWLEKSII